MRNWAFVVGIDHYPDMPRAALGAAVRDALKFREWLLSPDGGDVAPEQMTVLLSPRPDSAPPVPYQPASYASIVTELPDLLARAGDDSNRFFFYFAGHGLTRTIGPVKEDAVCLQDFRETITTFSVTLGSILERLRGA